MRRLISDAEFDHESNLRGTDLTAANLRGAIFTGVDLHRTIGLTQTQIAMAKLDAKTRTMLPPGLK